MLRHLVSYPARHKQPCSPKHAGAVSRNCGLLGNDSPSDGVIHVSCFSVAAIGRQNGDWVRAENITTVTKRQPGSSYRAFARNQQALRRCRSIDLSRDPGSCRLTPLKPRNEVRETTVTGTHVSGLLVYSLAAWPPGNAMRSEGFFHMPRIFQLSLPSFTRRQSLLVPPLLAAREPMNNLRRLVVRYVFSYTLGSE